MPRTAGQVESGLPMQQPDFVAASSEHSDDMLDDDEDDLHLANVNVNKVHHVCIPPEYTTLRRRCVSTCISSSRINYLNSNCHNTLCLALASLSKP